MLDPIDKDTERLVKLLTTNTKCKTLFKKDSNGDEYTYLVKTDETILRRDEQYMDVNVREKYRELQEFYRQLSRYKKGRDTLIRLKLIDTNRNEYLAEYVNIRSAANILKVIDEDYTAQNIFIEKIIIMNISDITTRYNVIDIINTYEKYYSVRLGGNPRELKMYMNQLPIELYKIIIFIENTVQNRLLDINVEAVKDDPIIDDDNEVF